MHDRETRDFGREYFANVDNNDHDQLFLGHFSLDRKNGFSKGRLYRKIDVGRRND